MTTNFNYNHLFYFYVTAKVGSVTRAAKILRTSQPSLSTQLKTLEARLDRPLFQRSGRRLVLTHQGRVVYGFCARAFDATEALSRYLKDADRVSTEKVVIGVSEEIDRLFVTRRLTKALAALPKEARPDVKMVSHSHEDLAARIAVGEIDYLVTAKRIYDREAKLLAEVKLPVVLVGPITHRARSHGSSLRELKMDLVLPSPELKLRDEVDSYIQRGRIDKTVAFESNMLSALLQAVSGGLGVGFFPAPYIRDALATGAVKSLETKALWHHRILLIATPRCAESSFSSTFQKHLADISY